MINVAGNIRRAYLFPADRPTAFNYYRDLGRLLEHLPHIQLVHTYGDNQFRMLYSSLELGAYHVNIYADVQVGLDEQAWVLRVSPLDGLLKASPKAGLNWSTAQGIFASEHIFQQAGEETQIEYALQLRARLPTPAGLRLMPGRTVDYIAESIVKRRMREISNGFIESSIARFPAWLETGGIRPSENHHPPPKHDTGPLPNG